MIIHPEALKLLLPLYNSPNRYYHNLNHIQYCLSKLDEFMCNSKEIISSENMKVLTYAIWFHDAIYSIYPLTFEKNEHQSAHLFKEFISTYTYIATAKQTSEVINLIKATEHHLNDNKDTGILIKIMLDIDLAGLGDIFTVFRNNSKNILKEYAPLGLGIQQLQINRNNFLQKFLNKDRIFYTDYFCSKYEVKARQNIKEEIEKY